MCMGVTDAGDRGCSCLEHCAGPATEVGGASTPRGHIKQRLEKGSLAHIAHARAGKTTNVVQRNAEMATDDARKLSQALQAIGAMLPGVFQLVGTWALPTRCWQLGPCSCPAYARQKRRRSGHQVSSTGCLWRPALAAVAGKWFGVELPRHLFDNRCSTLGHLRGSPGLPGRLSETYDQQVFRCVRVTYLSLPLSASPQTPSSQLCPMCPSESTKLCSMSGKHRADYITLDPTLAKLDPTRPGDMARLQGLRADFRATCRTTTALDSSAIDLGFA